MVAELTGKGLGVKIAAVAHTLPARVWTNQELIDTHKLRLKDAWVRENIGIEARHFCSEGESASTLAASVCQKLLAKAGLTPGDVDRLIVATVSPDVLTPSTACITQSLFAPGELFPCVDLVAACGGFLYALDYGRRCVQTGDERVLCVAAEVRSAFLNKQDRRTVMLFGDGAAGVLLTRAAPTEVGIVDTRVHADGRYWDLISVPAGGTRVRTSAESLAAGEHFITMKDGSAIFERAVSEMGQLVESALERHGFTLADVDFFVFHQASANIVRRICERLSIDERKTRIDFPLVGNTTAASVPLVLSQAVEAGQIQPGALVVMVATGGGFTAGVALLRWEG
jgi:3-oxoacyl-[acyl-carrier-protein] synthase-3